MPRLPETTKDSRSTMIVNGASVAIAVMTVGVWLASSPDLPRIAKLGLGLAISLVTMAFVALVIHRSTLHTVPRHFPHAV